MLAPATVDEMCHPQVMWDIDAWNLAWGLGFMLLRKGDRILVGHEGAMPGFLAGCYTRRSDSCRSAATAPSPTATAAPPCSSRIFSCFVVLVAKANFRS